jgi:hypothetical protein
MMKNVKEYRKRFYDIERKSINKIRTCCYPGCHQNTIASHNISESLLSLVAEKGHVRKFNVHPFDGLEFRSEGIRRATTFHGFCSKHDNEFFNNIDHFNFARTLLKNVLLFNYRATIQEKILKQIKKDAYSEILLNFKDSGHPVLELAKQRIRDYPFNEACCISSGDSLLESIQNIENCEYLVHSYEIPYIEVIASELFTMEPLWSTQIKKNLFLNYSSLFQLADIYVQIIPAANKNFTVLNISTHKRFKAIFSQLCTQWSKLSVEQLISDFLLLYLDQWVCSETFYQKHILSHKPEIDALFLNTSHQAAIDRQNFIVLSLYKRQ